MGRSGAMVVLALAASSCGREPNELHAELRGVAPDANIDPEPFIATSSSCQYRPDSSGGGILGIGASRSRGGTFLSGRHDRRSLDIEFWDMRLERKTYVLDETNVGNGDSKKFLVSWHESEATDAGYSATARSWAVVGGTITVDHADDDELRLHGELQMAPSPYHPEGTRSAVGTFTLVFRGSIHDARL